MVCVYASYTWRARINITNVGSPSYVLSINAVTSRSSTGDALRSEGGRAGSPSTDHCTDTPSMPPADCVAVWVLLIHVVRKNLFKYLLSSDVHRLYQVASTCGWKRSERNGMGAWASLIISGVFFLQNRSLTVYWHTPYYKEIHCLFTCRQRSSFSVGKCK